MSNIQKKSRLRNLDDIYLMGEEDNTSAAVISETQTMSQENQIAQVDINMTVPFSKHPFRLYSGERFEDMIESVRKNGIIIPVIVRKTAELYEILSGHNRVNAAKHAGLTKIPVIIKENLSDDEAWVYVIETNLMQRSFSDMSHSEKAAVIALHHSKMFSQGKRNDIIAELRRIDNINSVHTYAQNEHKLNSREIVAQEYGLNRNTVARYLRIHKLVPDLKKRLDENDIPFIAAVTLSFLKEEHQDALEKCLEMNSFRIDGKKAARLRQDSESGLLDSDRIYLILSNEPEKPAPTSRTIRKSIFAKYFRPDQPYDEVQDVIEKSLEQYFTTTNK